MPKSLKIAHYGDLILRARARPVDAVDLQLVSFLDDMEYTMLHEDGAGLAAPQVYRSICAIVVSDDKRKIFKLINPKIVDRAGTCTMAEGCLSIPGVFVPVVRPATVKVSYVDLSEKAVIADFAGFVARVIQHEIDHLDGKLLMDDMTPDEKDWHLSNRKTR